MEMYQTTQAQREADLAHTEAAVATQAAKDACADARREYLQATDAVATMMELEGVSDELRNAVYRAISSAHREGTANEAVSTAKANQRLRAVLARVLSGTLVPSDFA